MELQVEQRKPNQNFQMKINSEVNLLEVNEEEIESFLTKHTYYQLKQDPEQQKFEPRQINMKLTKPSNDEPDFNKIETYKTRLQNIMKRAYQKKMLNMKQFEQFSKFFNLVNYMKYMSYPDPMILQTFRYVIFNRQVITQTLVKVVEQMSKGNLIKQWQVGYFTTHKVVMSEILAEQFEPPLDLYIEFIDLDLIRQSQEALKEVFSQNQYLYKRLSNKGQFCSTLSQKKRMILNQFPYLLDIFSRINSVNPNYSFAGLKLYITEFLQVLQLENQNHLLERYLPEVTCLYFKIKSQLSITDTQYLFTILKPLKNLNQKDLKILFPHQQNNVINPDNYKFKSWTDFACVSELCTKILTEKQFFLSEKQFEYLVQKLDYQNCVSDDIIKMNLIFFILKQSSFKQKLPNFVLLKIAKIFKQVPDKKKKKQCLYIFLSQYLKLASEEQQKNQKIIQQFNFDELELENVLDQGRLLALEILYYKEGIVYDKKLYSFMEILKNLIMTTMNDQIRIKAIQLQKKIKIQNKIQSQSLQIFRFIEQKIQKHHQIVQFLQQRVKKGKKLSEKGIQNIIKILNNSKNHKIISKCISTFRHAVKNINQGQKFPQGIIPQIIQVINTAYFENQTQNCKNQILKLIIELASLSETYDAIENLTNPLINIYLKSSQGSILKINSSYAFYTICKKFKKSSKQLSKTKLFFTELMNNILTLLKTTTPKNKDYLNILCSICALTKNQIQLPVEVVDQLIKISLTQKQFSDIPLITILMDVRNKKQQNLSQKNLMDICQILNQNQNDKILAVKIIESYYQRCQNLPNQVKDIIKILTSVQKCSTYSCEILCKFSQIGLKIRKQNA